MDIKIQIEAELRKARLARDEATTNVANMIKNQVLVEVKSAAGVVEDNALWLRVVSAYAKQLRKALTEFEGLGAVRQVSETRFELEFCERFLPQRLGAEETETLVRRIASESGISDPKLKGKLIGLVMKGHKDVDGDLVRSAVEKVLAVGQP